MHTATVKNTESDRLTPEVLTFDEERIVVIDSKEGLAVAVQLNFVI